MNHEETLKVLAKIAVYCKMTPPGKADVQAWYEIPAIQAMDFERASQAVTIYYQQHKSPMMPVDLIQTVKALPVPHYSKEEFEELNLITIQQYGVERFWANYDACRDALDLPPSSAAQRRRVARDLGVESLLPAKDATDVSADLTDAHGVWDAAAFDPDSAF